MLSYVKREIEMKAYQAGKSIELFTSVMQIVKLDVGQRWLSLYVEALLSQTYTSENGSIRLLAIEIGIIYLQLAHLISGHP